MTDFSSFWRPASRWLLALGLLVTAGAAQAQTTNFAYTGGTQTYTVPAGITRLSVVATGDSGGTVPGGSTSSTGRVQATVTVVPGEMLTVVVGGQATDDYGTPGGYNGGGSGSFAGGGGATDLRRTGANTGDYLTSRNALLVAGGSGGGGYQGNTGGSAKGGNGGTPNGANGSATNGGTGGTGATTAAAGGNGSNATGGNSGGNGGGGYYGGGGSATFGGVYTGGGGSSYVLPTGSSAISYGVAAACGDGALAITPQLPPTNNALAFDGVNDYVTIPNNAAYTITAAITLEAWVRTSVAQEQYITTKSDDSWYLAMNGGGGPTGAASFYLNGPSPASGGWLYGTTNLADGRWHHVAGTYDGATLRLYVDGVLQSSRAATGAIPTGTSPVSIGARNATATWNGSLDEFRLYNTALTAAQVQADMFSTTAALPGNQKAYFNLDQGIAGGNNAGLTSLTDQSSTGNAGTLNNFALTATSSNWVRSFPTITGINPTSGNVGTAVNGDGHQPDRCHRHRLQRHQRHGLRHPRQRPHHRRERA